MYNIIKYLALYLALLLSGGTLIAQDTKDFTSRHFKGLTDQQVVDSLLRASENFAEENPDTALFLANIALNICENSDNRELLPEASFRIAEAHFFMDEYQKAIEYYNKAASDEYKIKKDSTGFLADMLTYSALCYQELGLSEKALQLNKTALKIVQKLNIAKQIGDVLNNIGTNYFSLSMFDKAIEYYSKTLELDRKSGDSSALSISLNNLGLVYSRWGKHQEAIRFYTESLGYTTEEAKKSIRFSKIGMTWYHLKDYDKALEYLHLALKIALKYNQEIKIGIRKNEISTVLVAKGNYAEALRLNEEALGIFRKAGIVESQIITLSDMGNIFRKLKQTEKAEQCFLESASLAEKSQSLYHQARNFKNLYEIAETEGDYKKALGYFRKYTAAHDSVFNIEKHKQLANFEILYETDKKEKENQLLLLDLKLKQRNQRLGISIIIGLILVLLLTYSLLRVKSKNLKQNQLLFRQEQDLARLEIENKEAENRMLSDRVFAEQQINRLEREKYQAEIDHKNAELASSTICLVNKNEILGEIREKLKNNHHVDNIHEVVQFINSNTDIDQDWLKFRTTFENVHPGFFDGLKQEFPQLTDHDIRLSAYLRINLSSREIAGLMNVSLDATNKSRQRLRKKLNLEAEADLTVFLTSL
ncbi:MAG: tetratricopeptide repeat protein [Bacteroidales bacterium]|nr:tetratricopeptide repeat protein [Bacteroidales bacterium]